VGGLVVASMLGVITFQLIKIFALNKQIASIELSPTNMVPERGREGLSLTGSG
jgi:hypothetical protein